MAKMMKMVGSGKMPAVARDDGGSACHPRVEAQAERDSQGEQQAEEEESEEGNRMAVKLRLTRVGSKKNPIYRVVAADSRSPRDGKFIEIVGRYNPQSDPSLIDLDEEKVRGWLEKGAQPTESVAKLLKAQGIRVAHGGAASPSSRRRLVDEPDAVRVEEVEEEDGTLVLRLHVAEADIGKVIGRQGRLARALRTIVRAGGVEAGRRLQLEIVD